MNQIANILLDRLPQDYEGYLIRTDFGIGIQLALCSIDPGIDENEKAAIMLNLLYGRGMPDFETAIKGLQWFMLCGKEPPSGEPDDRKPAVSYSLDDTRIFSAFRRVFGLDLTKERLHWFQFCAMFNDIEGSAMADIIGYRKADLSKMKGEQRAAYAKMQKRFSIPSSYAEEDEAKINEFLTQLNSSDN